MSFRQRDLVGRLGGLPEGRTRKSLPMTLTRTLFAAALASVTISANALDVTAKSAIIVDGASGKVLWQKDADAIRFPASTTKVMTGLLLVEHCKPDDMIVAPKDVDQVGEASMHLRPGERIRAKDLLYGIMLRSANDGAYAAAVHLGGSAEGFAKMMNDRAKQLGCTHTNFVNANGLHNKKHYTSARDLALMSVAAMKYPWFSDVVKTKKVKISRDKNYHDLWMVNHDKMLRYDPTCDGIKTGFTVPAGACFLGSASREGWRVITVLLKSDDWKHDNQEMMKWAFQNFGKSQELAPNAPIGEAKVEGGTDDKVPVTSADPVYVVGPKGKAPLVTQKVVQATPVKAPILKGQTVATLETTYPDGFVARTPLIAQKDIETASVVQTVRKTKPTAPFVACGLLVGVAFLRRRSRRTGIYGKAFN